jgi:hypothetical protein
LISARLEVSLRRIKPVVTGTGQSITVSKNAIITREFDKLALRLKSGNKSYISGGGSLTAERAGRAAGNKAGFGRPVNGGKEIKVIKG